MPLLRLLGVRISYYDRKCLVGGAASLLILGTLFQVSQNPHSPFINSIGGRSGIPEDSSSQAIGPMVSELRNRFEEFKMDRLEHINDTFGTTLEDWMIRKYDYGGKGGTLDDLHFSVDAYVDRLERLVVKWFPEPKNGRDRQENGTVGILPAWMSVPRLRISNQTAGGDELADGEAGGEGAESESRDGNQVDEHIEDSYDSLPLLPRTRRSAMDRTPRSKPRSHPSYGDEVRHPTDESRHLMLASLDRQRQHISAPLLKEPMIKRVLTMDKDAPNMPGSFKEWSARLPDWTIETLNDQGMEEMVDRLTRGGGERLQELWGNIPAPVLKSDLLRRLRLHPFNWGTGNIPLLHQRLQPLHTAITALAPLIDDDHELQPSERRYPIEPLDEKRNGITSSDVSMVLAIEYDASAVENDLRNWGTAKAGKNVWRSMARTVQICQWTMMSKPFHPIFIDVVVSILEAMEEALNGGNLVEGRLRALDLTGPGTFSDAVFRHFVAAHGITPLDLYDPERTNSVRRIGDVILLPMEGFRYPGHKLEGNWESDDDRWSAVSHFYYGRWKGKGWGD